MSDKPTILEFFFPPDIEQALRQNGWTIAEMVRILTDVAKDENVKPQSRMAAMKMLDDKMMQSLQLSGMVSKVTGVQEQIGADGTKKVLTAERSSLLMQQSERTMALLEQGFATGAVIDVPVTIKHEEKTDERPSGNGGTGERGRGEVGGSAADGAGEREAVPPGPAANGEDHDGAGVGGAEGAGTVQPVSGRDRTVEALGHRPPARGNAASLTRVGDTWKRE